MGRCASQTHGDGLRVRLFWEITISRNLKVDPQGQWEFFNAQRQALGGVDGEAQALADIQMTRFARADFVRQAPITPSIISSTESI
jgi:hypothetical protein